MDTECAAQTGDYGKSAFDLCYQRLLLFGVAGRVQHLRDLIAGEDIARHMLARGPVVFVQIRDARISEKLLAAFQRGDVNIQQLYKGLLVIAHAALLPPCGREIHAALEIGNGNIRAFFQGLQNQHLQQYAFTASGGAAEQNMRDACQIDRHRAGIALPEDEHETFWGNVLVPPWE